MIVLIDNYDSFTYNLYQYISHFNADITVFRNDEVTLNEIERLNPTHLVISPGPKYPKDAGISIEAVRYFTGKLPILGICLGHQSIAEAFDAKVVRANQILHGKTSMITLALDCPIFKGLKERIKVGRYHSLIVDKDSLTDELVVTATDDKGEIMALEHRYYPTYGLQFHPESILTPEGQTMIQNFLEVPKC